MPPPSTYKTAKHSAAELHALVPSFIQTIGPPLFSLVFSQQFDSIAPANRTTLHTKLSHRIEDAAECLQIWSHQLSPNGPQRQAVTSLYSSIADSEGRTQVDIDGTYNPVMRMINWYARTSGEKGLPAKGVVCPMYAVVEADGRVSFYNRLVPSVSVTLDASADVHRFLLLLFFGDRAITAIDAKGSEAGKLYWPPGTYSFVLNSPTLSNRKTRRLTPRGVNADDLIVAYELL